MTTSFSIVDGIQEYVRTMLDAVNGMKVLVLDQETMGMLSVVFSQSQILDREVFLVERLESDNREKMRHLNAVCFLRPTADTFLRLSKELKNPCYAEYHIFFANVAPHSGVERLAKLDDFELVKQVHEYFVDVYAINREVFSLNLPLTVGLFQERNSWTNFDEMVYERIISGLLSCVLALRRRPLIRYLKTSELCRDVANKLQQRIMEERTLFDNIRHGGSCTLLILDRREDPVTPLLNQWTYQAMLHELLGIEKNRVDMRKAPGIADDLHEIVMGAVQDQFFEQHLLSNFGDLGGAIKNYVEAYQAQTKTTGSIESIEEMQRFVDQYPKFRKLSGNVSKHVAVVHELSRIVDTNNLLDVSCLEQDLACTESRNEHYKDVLEKIKSSKVGSMERLRLAMLFALRYENDPNFRQIKDALKTSGIEEDQISLIDALLSYAGAHVRSGDLFQNKNFLALAKNQIQRGFKGVPNVYTQHKTLLSSTLESFVKGKLKESQFPYVGSNAPNSTGSSRERPAEAIVFVIGGTTFEEARDVHELSRQEHCRFVLGGTTLHNSKSFLADIAQLVKGRFASLERSASSFERDPFSSYSTSTTTAGLV